MMKPLTTRNHEGDRLVDFSTSHPLDETKVEYELQRDGSLALLLGTAEEWSIPDEYSES